MSQPMSNATNDDFITIYDLLAFAWKYRLVIALGTVLGILAGVALPSLRSTGYSSDVTLDLSTSTVLVNQDPKALNQILASALSRSTLVTPMAEDAIKSLLATDKNTAEALSSFLRAAPAELPRALSSHIRSLTSAATRAGIPPKAPFSIYIEMLDPAQLRITVSTPSPGISQPIANAIAAALPKLLSGFNAAETESRASESEALSRAVPKAVLNHQHSLQRLANYIQLFVTDLSKAAPNSAQVAAPTAPIVIHDMNVLQGLEIHQLRKRLALAWNTLSAEARTDFETRLVNIASQHEVVCHHLAFVKNSFAPAPQVTATPTSPNLPEIDSAATPDISVGSVDLHPTKRAMFLLLGLFGGFFVSVGAALALQIGSRAREEMARSRFA